MRFDNVDTILGCVRLTWHRTSAEYGKLSTNNEFGFVSVETIKRTVHPVGTNIAV